MGLDDRSGTSQLVFGASKPRTQLNGEDIRHELASSYLCIDQQILLPFLYFP